MRDINTRPSQVQKIILHMVNGHTITSAEAMYEYGIMSLPKRICEIQKLGYVIKKKQEKNENRFGDTVYYIRYSLDMAVTQTNHAKEQIS